MNSFVKGLLVGAGIGLLVAPMKGEQLRNLLAERFEELRANLPENPQLEQYTQQVTSRVSRTAGNLKNLAQQAASTVQSAGSQLGNIAQQATSDVKRTGQSVASTTKQAVSQATSNTTGTGAGTPPTGGPASGAGA